MPKEDIKTDTLKINSAPFIIKVVREFGLPTLFAIFAFGGWMVDRFYFMQGVEKTQSRIERRVKRTAANVKILMQQKGFHVVPEEDEEIEENEDK